MMKRALAIAKLLLAALAGAVALWVLAVIAVLVLPSSCTSRRPPDSELLQRHLGLDSTNGFACVETRYQPAREWSAWFYLKASPERLSQLLTDLRFKEIQTSENNDLVRVVTSNSEHSLSVDSSVKVFEKQPPEEILWHYAVRSADGTQLWLWVHRF